jgi:hypothetical protein
MITNSHRNEREASHGESPVILVLMLFVMGGVGLYLVVARMHILLSNSSRARSTCSLSAPPLPFQSSADSRRASGAR